MPKEFINDGKLSDEELEMILGKVQTQGQGFIIESAIEFFLNTPRRNMVDFMPI